MNTYWKEVGAQRSREGGAGKGVGWGRRNKGRSGALGYAEGGLVYGDAYQDDGCLLTWNSWGFESPKYSEEEELAGYSFIQSSFHFTFPSPLFPLCCTSLLLLLYSPFLPLCFFPALLSCCRSLAILFLFPVPCFVLILFLLVRTFYFLIFYFYHSFMKTF